MLMKILEKLSYRLHGGSADLALYIDHEGTIRIGWWTCDPTRHRGMGRGQCCK